MKNRNRSFLNLTGISLVLCTAFLIMPGCHKKKPLHTYTTPSINLHHAACNQFHNSQSPTLVAEVLAANAAVQIEPQPALPPRAHTHHIVVFIHGATTFIPSISAFRYAWQQTSAHNSNESFYQHYQNKIRFGGYRKRQPIGLKGLWKIDVGDDEKSTCVKNAVHTREARIIAHWYRSVHEHVCGEQFNSYSLYTFGWDGSMSQRNRKEWSHILYNSLVKELRSHEEQSPEINHKITLLCHSHGGNVALNLVKFEEEYKKSLMVDKLFLFGTPIQSETKHLAHERVFRCVYNMYSKGDWIQKLDCMSTRDFFSGRRLQSKKALATHTSQDTPSQVYDIEFRVNNYKPAHAEFWFMGGILHFFYRTRFPLYPFPIAIFAPCIERIIEHATPQTRHVRMVMKRTKDHYAFTVADNQTKLPLDVSFHAAIPLTAHHAS